MRQSPTKFSRFWICNWVRFSASLSVEGNFPALENLTLAVVRKTRIKVHVGVAMMNLLGWRQKQWLRFLTADVVSSVDKFMQLVHPNDVSSVSRKDAD